MPESCQAVGDALAELSRTPGEPLASALESHAATCPECKRAVAGARALGGRLSSWAEPETPEGLVARTLARVRLANAHLAEGKMSGASLATREPGSQRLAPITAIPPAPAAPAAGLPGHGASLQVPVGAQLERAHQRRSSVELLALWALPGPRPAVVDAARGKLGVRLAIQAAAAVVLFVLCTGFTVTFYPVAVQALEDSRLHLCQERLARLGQALKRYRVDHPEAASDFKSPYALRDTLVQGGYAREEDFVCPAAHAGRGSVSFFLKLPDASGNGHAVVGYDFLGNHAEGLNVLRADGRVEHLGADELGERLGPR